MDTSALFNNVPKYISTRFYTINNYAWKSFFPDNSLNERLRKIDNEKLSKKELTRIKEIVSEASLVIFIFLLRRFFLEGANAAKQAVDTFGDLGVEGFQIGSKFFHGRNKNVIEGDVLAEALMASIENQELLDLIKNSNYVYQIVDRYRKIIEKEN